MMSYCAIVISGNKKKEVTSVFSNFCQPNSFSEGAVIEGGVIPGRDQTVTDAVPRYNNNNGGFTGVTHSVH